MALCSPPTSLAPMRTLCALVVPELQRRGLFHREYADVTLRENVDLRIPAGRLDVPQARRLIWD